MRKLCAICSIDPETGHRGTNATTRICPKCRLDPANVDWVESPDDRPASAGQLGLMEEFLFQNIRRIVREEVRAALDGVAQSGAMAKPELGTDYLSIEEAAKIARLHHTTIRDWIKDGSLKAFRAGRVYRIRRSDLDERLTAKAADPVASDIEDRINAIVAKRLARAA